MRSIGFLILLFLFSNVAWGGCSMGNVNINGKRIYGYCVCGSGAQASVYNNQLFSLELNGNRSCNHAISHLAVLYEGDTIFKSDTTLYQFIMFLPPKPGKYKTLCYLTLKGGLWESEFDLTVTEPPQPKESESPNPIASTGIPDPQLQNITSINIESNGQQVTCLSLPGSLSQLEIYDLSGKLIYTCRPRSQYLQLPREKFNGSVYLFSYRNTNGETQNRKIFVPPL